MKKNKKEMKKTTEYVNEKIPSFARKSLLTMLILMIGYGLFPSTINAGGIIAASFSFTDMILVFLVGNTILFIYALLLALIGTREGLTLHELSKRIFGKKGYRITSTIIFISQIGWFGIGITLLANPIIHFFNIESWLVKYIIIIVIGFSMTTVALYGVKSLKIASIIAIPIVLCAGILIILFSIQGGEWGNWSPDKPPQNKLTFFEGVTIVIGTFISGATLIPDFIRWSKNRKHTIIVVFFTFMINQMFLLMIGGIAYSGVDGNLFDQFDGSITIFSTLMIMGLGWLGFLALFSNVWTSNDNSLYASSLAASSIYNVKKRKMVLILGISGTLLAPIFNSNTFVLFLNLLGIMIPGIGIIAIIYYFWFYKLTDDENNYHLEAILAWVMGIILTELTQFWLPFIMPLYIMIFTGLIYICLFRVKFLIESWKSDKISK